MRIAETGATQARTSKSVKALNDSLRLWDSLGDVSSVARTHLEIGDLSYERADAVSAIHSYEEARRLCISIGDSRCAAEAENNVGIAAQQLGDFELAERRLQESIKEWRRIANPVSEGIALSNLGWLHSQTGEYTEAVASLVHAADVLQPRDSVAWAKTLNSLGLCYSSMMDFANATHDFEAALAVFRKYKMPDDAARVTINLGRTNFLEGHLRQAESLLEGALGQARAIPDPRTLADVLNNLGQVLLKRGRIPEAKADFEEALVDDRDLHDKRAEAFDLHYLGMAASQNHETDRARELFLQALQIRTDIGLRDDASESLIALTELEISARQFEPARAYAERALNTSESVREMVPGSALRAAYYARKRRLFDDLVDLAASEPGKSSAEHALLASERGRARALLDVLAEKSILRKIPSDLASRRATVQRRLDLLAFSLSSADPEHQNEIRAQIQSLLAEDEEVEAAIRSQAPDPVVGLPMQSPQQLKRALPANAALLEFHLGCNHSYLWLVGDGPIQKFDLPPRARIERQAAEVTARFNRISERRRKPGGGRETLQASLDSLSKTLLGPVRAGITARTLILVPDGVLHRVPFAALSAPGDSRALGLAHDLIQVPSASVLINARPPKAPDTFPHSVLAIADPVFTPNVKPGSASTRAAAAAPEPPNLPRVPFDTEIRTLSGLMPASRITILRGFDANRRRLESMEAGDFALIHISTHALIDDRLPELSRIALSFVTPSGQIENGFLRPYQLGELRLKGSIVVLSACDTALGKDVPGEGIVGFAGSLFDAGASQVVLTLTDIDAEASSDFFSEVYRQYFGGNVSSMERALTLARNTMAGSRRWSDPYYWASIIVLGRPTRT